MEQESVKGRFAGFFAGLHADTKRFRDNGITGAAAQLGRNPTTLCYQLKPDNLKDAPTLETALELIELTQSVRAVNAIADLVGCVAVPVDYMGAPTGIKDGAAAFSQKVANALVGALIARDSTLTHDLRTQQYDAVNELIQVAVAYRNALKG